jgi:hypothetical protein
MGCTRRRRARDRLGEIPDDRRGGHREHDIVTSRDTPAVCPQPLLRISAVAAPTHDPVDGCRDTTPDTTWRERALNAEDALKAAHIEIRTRRNRIAQLMGQIRDMETRWTDESISHITTEKPNLKQRLRQLTQDNRAIDERLQAARSNSRFQDRRIAQLEAHLLEPGRLR